MHSLASTFDLVASNLPRALFSDVARSALRATCAQLPAALSHCLYFECRPESPNVVDLVVDVDRSGREILAGRNSAIAIDRDLLAQRSWRQVSNFAQRWTDPWDALHGRVRDAWLEFDLAAEARPVTPSIFVDFAPEIARGDAAGIADAVTLAARALDLPGDAAVASSLAEFVAALSAQAMVVYAGFMLARDTTAIRLCVMGLDRADVGSLLGRMHWRGNVGDAVDFMDAIARPAGGGQDRPAIVHFDIGRALGDVIGLEYPFARAAQLEGVIAEQDVLGTLVDRGLLDQAQRDALSAWPGFERVTMPHELWPSILVRRVNHAKLVLRPNEPPRAKLYLCAEHLMEHAYRGPRRVTSR